MYLELVKNRFELKEHLAHPNSNSDSILSDGA
jgi:hypothetical protein